MIEILVSRAKRSRGQMRMLGGLGIQQKERARHKGISLRSTHQSIITMTFSFHWICHYSGNFEVKP